jgi:glycosyltransferase involved in cell wall biosynthesis
LNNASKKRIVFLHCISGLSVGGAEGMLAKLCRQLSAHTHHVIVMSRRLEMADQLCRSGVLVHALELGLIRELLRLKSRTEEETVRINGWMYHGNLLALAIRTVFFRGSPLVWHVRQSLDNRRAMRPRTRLVMKANQVLSRRVPLVLFNSSKAMSDHLGSGWCSTNCKVWFNGFDPAVFESRARSRESFRLRLQAGRHDTVLMSVGRFHPDKDYENLLAAVQPILEADDHVNLALIGRGLDPGNRELMTLIDPRLSARIHLLGPQTDVASWLAAADLFILHSRAESFPNALGEAVFSRRLCIATNVGDAGLLLPGGETQVAPEDAHALRQKIEEVLSWPKQKKDRYVSSCYNNALKRFSLQDSAEQYMLLTG